MRHILKIILFAFFLTAYAQANAGITSCGVMAAPDSGGQEEGEKKNGKKDGKKDGKKKKGTEGEEEEPDCD